MQYGTASLHLRFLVRGSVMIFSCNRSAFIKKCYILVTLLANIGVCVCVSACVPLHLIQEEYFHLRRITYRFSFSGCFMNCIYLCFTLFIFCVIMLPFVLYSPMNLTWIEIEEDLSSLIFSLTIIQEKNPTHHWTWFLTDNWSVRSAAQRRLRAPRQTKQIEWTINKTNKNKAIFQTYYLLRKRCPTEHSAYI